MIKLLFLLIDVAFIFSCTYVGADEVGDALATIINLPTSIPTVLPTTKPPSYGGHDDDENDGNRKQAKIVTDIKIGEFTINVGKINVEINKKNKCDKEGNGNGGSPYWPIITPPWGLDANDTTVWPDNDVPREPGADEVVLGEADVSTQGLPPIGGVVATVPVIYSFTYKIETEKKVHVETIIPLKQVVTFVIRGAHFDITKLLGIDDDLVSGKRLGSLFEPRVFLGAIPLKLVKFTDTFIEARFEDIDDQKSFKPGSYLVRVKVLHVEKKLGILSTDSSSADISTLGGLSLPELDVIGAGLPVLPVIKSPITSPFSLISLFNGLKFDTASLVATFSQNDADKIAKAAKVIKI